MSRPFKLYRLQQIDSQLDWMKKRLGEIEAALNDNQLLRQAKEELEIAEANLDEARKALRRAEDYVAQQRIKIEQSESTLYGGKVRNPKELKDLENEVASLKRFLVVLEDRQLEAMMIDEEAQSLHHHARSRLEEIQRQFQQQSVELIKEQEKLMADAARVEEERHAAANALDAQDLAIYHQLREKRRGIAVAKVVNRACAACGSTLNAALEQATHSPNQITRCERCGRILYSG